MKKIKHYRELATDGWLFKVGDVLSNPYENTHFKVITIELAEDADPEDARIYGHRVCPHDHKQRVVDHDVFVGADREYHRAWYFNESWSMEQ